MRRSEWALASALTLVSIASCGGGQQASLGRCDVVARQNLADVQIDLQPALDLQAFADFIEEHKLSYRVPKGPSVDVLSTYPEAREIYLYTREPLERSDEQIVARTLKRFSEVEDVNFRVRQKSGIKPGPVDCE
jgi:hypothetical protein